MDVRMSTRFSFFKFVDAKTFNEGENETLRTSRGENNARR
jgi:hypothetical protein